MSPTTTAKARPRTACGRRPPTRVPNSAPAPVATASVDGDGDVDLRAGDEVAREGDEPGERDDHERGGNGTPQPEAEDDGQHGHDHEAAADPEEPGEQADPGAREDHVAHMSVGGQSPSPSPSGDSPARRQVATLAAAMIGTKPSTRTFGLTWPFA